MTEVGEAKGWEESPPAEEQQQEKEPVAPDKIQQKIQARPGILTTKVVRKDNKVNGYLKDTDVLGQLVVLKGNNARPLAKKVYEGPTIKAHPPKYLSRAVEKFVRLGDVEGEFVAGITVTQEVKKTEKPVTYLVYKVEGLELGSRKADEEYICYNDWLGETDVIPLGDTVLGGLANRPNTYIKEKGFQRRSHCANFMTRKITGGGNFEKRLNAQMDNIATNMKNMKEILVALECMYCRMPHDYFDCPNKSVVRCKTCNGYGHTADLCEIGDVLPNTHNDNRKKDKRWRCSCGGTHKKDFCKTRGNIERIDFSKRCGHCHGFGHEMCGTRIAKTYLDDKGETVSTGVNCKHCFGLHREAKCPLTTIAEDGGYDGDEVYTKVSDEWLANVIPKARKFLATRGSKEDPSYSQQWMRLDLDYPLGEFYDGNITKTQLNVARKEGNNKAKDQAPGSSHSLSKRGGGSGKANRTYKNSAGKGDASTRGNGRGRGGNRGSGRGGVRGRGRGGSRGRGRGHNITEQTYQNNPSSDQMADMFKFFQTIQSGGHAIGQSGNSNYQKKQTGRGGYRGGKNGNNGLESYKKSKKYFPNSVEAPVIKKPDNILRYNLDSPKYEKLNSSSDTEIIEFFDKYGVPIDSQRTQKKMPSFECYGVPSLRKPIAKALGLQEYNHIFCGKSSQLVYWQDPRCEIKFDISEAITDAAHDDLVAMPMSQLKERIGDRMNVGNPPFQPDRQIESTARLQRMESYALYVKIIRASPRGCILVVPAQVYYGLKSATNGHVLAIFDNMVQGYGSVGGCFLVHYFDTTVNVQHILTNNLQDCKPNLDGEELKLIDVNFLASLPMNHMHLGQIVRTISSVVFNTPSTKPGIMYNKTPSTFLQTQSSGGGYVVLKTDTEQKVIVRQPDKKIKAPEIVPVNAQEKQGKDYTAEKYKHDMEHGSTSGDNPLNFGTMSLQDVRIELKPSHCIAYCYEKDRGCFVGTSTLYPELALARKLMIVQTAQKSVSGQVIHCKGEVLAVFSVTKNEDCYTFMKTSCSGCHKGSGYRKFNVDCPDCITVPFGTKVLKPCAFKCQKGKLNTILKDTGKTMILLRAALLKYCDELSLTTENKSYILASHGLNITIGKCGIKIPLYVESYQLWAFGNLLTEKLPEVSLSKIEAALAKPVLERNEDEKMLCRIDPLKRFSPAEKRKYKGTPVEVFKMANGKFIARDSLAHRFFAGTAVMGMSTIDMFGYADPDKFVTKHAVELSCNTLKFVKAGYLSLVPAVIESQPIEVVFEDNIVDEMTIRNHQVIAHGTDDKVIGTGVVGTFRDGPAIYTCKHVAECTSYYKLDGRTIFTSSFIEVVDTRGNPTDLAILPLVNKTIHHLPIGKPGEGRAEVSYCLPKQKDARITRVKFNMVDEHLLPYDASLSINGSSGSPIFQYIGNTLYIVGIVTGMTDQKTVFIRMDNSVPKIPDSKQSAGGQIISSTSLEIIEQDRSSLGGQVLTTQTATPTILRQTVPKKWNIKQAASIVGLILASMILVAGVFSSAWFLSANHYHDDGLSKAVLTTPTYQPIPQLDRNGCVRLVSANGGYQIYSMKDLYTTEMMIVHRDYDVRDVYLLKKFVEFFKIYRILRYNPRSDLNVTIRQHTALRMSILLHKEIKLVTTIKKINRTDTIVDKPILHELLNIGLTSDGLIGSITDAFNTHTAVLAAPLIEVMDIAMKLVTPYITLDQNKTDFHIENKNMGSITGNRVVFWSALTGLRLYLRYMFRTIVPNNTQVLEQMPANTELRMASYDYNAALKYALEVNSPCAGCPHACDVVTKPTYYYMNSMANGSIIGKDYKCDGIILCDVITDGGKFEKNAYGCHQHLNGFLVYRYCTQPPVLIHRFSGGFDNTNTYEMQKQDGTNSPMILRNDPHNHDKILLIFPKAIPLILIYNKVTKTADYLVGEELFYGVTKINKANRIVEFDYKLLNTDPDNLFQFPQKDKIPCITNGNIRACFDFRLKFVGPDYDGFNPASTAELRGTTCTGQFESHLGTSIPAECWLHCIKWKWNEKQITKSVKWTGTNYVFSLGWLMKTNHNYTVGQEKCLCTGAHSILVNQDDAKTIVFPNGFCLSLDSEINGVYYVVYLQRIYEHTGGGKIVPCDTVKATQEHCQVIFHPRADQVSGLTHGLPEYCLEYSTPSEFCTATLQTKAKTVALANDTYCPCPNGKFGPGCVLEHQGLCGTIGVKMKDGCYYDSSQGFDLEVGDEYSWNPRYERIDCQIDDHEAIKNEPVASDASKNLASLILLSTMGASMNMASYAHESGIPALALSFNPNGGNNYDIDYEFPMSRPFGVASMLHNPDRFQLVPTDVKPGIKIYCYHFLTNTIENCEYGYFCELGRCDFATYLFVLDEKAEYEHSIIAFKNSTATYLPDSFGRERLFVNDDVEIIMNGTKYVFITTKKTVDIKLGRYRCQHNYFYDGFDCVKCVPCESEEFQGCIYGKHCMLVTPLGITKTALDVNPCAKSFHSESRNKFHIDYPSAFIVLLFLLSISRLVDKKDRKNFIYIYILYLVFATTYKGMTIPVPVIENDPFMASMTTVSSTASPTTTTTKPTTTAAPTTTTASPTTTAVPTTTASPTTTTTASPTTTAAPTTTTASPTTTVSPTTTAATIATTSPISTIKATKYTPVWAPADVPTVLTTASYEKPCFPSTITAGYPAIYNQSCGLKDVLQITQLLRNLEDSAFVSNCLIAITTHHGQPVTRLNTKLNQKYSPVKMVPNPQNHYMYMRSNTIGHEVTDIPIFIDNDGSVSVNLISCVYYPRIVMSYLSINPAITAKVIVTHNDKYYHVSSNELVSITFGDKHYPGILEASISKVCKTDLKGEVKTDFVVYRGKHIYYNKTHSCQSYCDKYGWYLKNYCVYRGWAYLANLGTALAIGLISLFTTLLLIVIRNHQTSVVLYYFIYIFRGISTFLLGNGWLFYPVVLSKIKFRFKFLKVVFVSFFTLFCLAAFLATTVSNMFGNIPIIILWIIFYFGRGEQGGIHWTGVVRASLFLSFFHYHHGSVIYTSTYVSCNQANPPLCTFRSTQIDGHATLVTDNSFTLVTKPIVSEINGTKIPTVSSVYKFRVLEQYVELRADFYTFGYDDMGLTDNNHYTCTGGLASLTDCYYDSTYGRYSNLAKCSKDLTLHGGDKGSGCVIGPNRMCGCCAARPLQGGLAALSTYSTVRLVTSYQLIYPDGSTQNCNTEVPCDVKHNGDLFTLRGDTNAYSDKQLTIYGTQYVIEHLPPVSCPSSAAGVFPDLCSRLDAGGTFFGAPRIIEPDHMWFDGNRHIACALADSSYNKTYTCMKSGTCPGQRDTLYGCHFNVKRVSNVTTLHFSDKCSIFDVEISGKTTHQVTGVVSIPQISHLTTKLKTEGSVSDVNTVLEISFQSSSTGSVDIYSTDPGCLSFFLAHTVSPGANLIDHTVVLKQPKCKPTIRVGQASVSVVLTAKPEHDYKPTGFVVKSHKVTKHGGGDCILGMFGGGCESMLGGILGTIGIIVVVLIIVFVIVYCCRRSSAANVLYNHAS